MRSVSKLQFVDRSGNRLDDRYVTAMAKLRQELWMQYPEVQDESDRDGAMGETLCRVLDFEHKNGIAEDLHGLIRRIFRQVVVSLLRGSHYRLDQESMDSRQLERIAGADKNDVCADIIVREFLDQLSSRERDIILLTARGFKADDIAQKVGTSLANVYQIVHRIREKARRLL
jgi:DNA-directed RNA polymerase specialized sigma24 family protein